MSFTYLGMVLGGFFIVLMTILAGAALFEKINPSRGKAFKKRASIFLRLHNVLLIILVLFLTSIACVALLAFFGLIWINFFS